MTMKTGFLASAAIAVAMLAAPPASAAEYTTILLDKVVNRTPGPDLGQDRSLLRHRHLAEGAPA